MNLEVEDIGLCLATDYSDNNIHQAEKSTQTEFFHFDAEMVSKLLG